MTGLSQILRWGPYDNARGWLRGLLVTLAGAAFLALAGAFDTGDAPLPLRFAYWLALMVLGWLWGAFVSRFAFARLSGVTHLWPRVVASSLLIGIPFSAVVAYAGVLIFHNHYPATAIPRLVVAVVTVTLVMVTINVLIDRQSRPMTLASAEPPKFLERLPLKLRGAEVWAVEAEDHYLRLHTSKGQDLILMRLSDAIAELDGIEGAQVHRSWWVARDAIAEARRGDGRATLTLKDGAEAPVSRSYARVLRERGWI
ncbi:MAG TPA: LytTR family DNA-binding domain-containing protein [Phenylobacterium sp.]|jgi:hypothetical protein